MWGNVIHIISHYLVFVLLVRVGASVCSFKRTPRNQLLLVLPWSMLQPYMSCRQLCVSIRKCGCFSLRKEADIIVWSAPLPFSNGTAIFILRNCFRFTLHAEAKPKLRHTRGQRPDMFLKVIGNSLKSHRKVNGQSTWSQGWAIGKSPGIHRKSCESHRKCIQKVIRKS